jgi:hypothetical protein
MKYSQPSMMISDSTTAMMTFLRFSMAALRRTPKTYSVDC